MAVAGYTRRRHERRGRTKLRAGCARGLDDAGFPAGSRARSVVRRPEHRPGRPAGNRTGLRAGFHHGRRAGCPTGDRAACRPGCAARRDRCKSRVHGHQAEDRVGFRAACRAQCHTVRRRRSQGCHPDTGDSGSSCAGRGHRSGCRASRTAPSASGNSRDCSPSGPSQPRSHAGGGPAGVAANPRPHARPGADASDGGSRSRGRRPRGNPPVEG